MTFIPQTIDWSKLLKADFWLEGIAGQNLVSQPLSENGFRNFFLVLFSVLLIGGIFLRLFKMFLPMQHPLQPKISVWTGNFIWMGFLGILWWLFNQWGPLLFIGSKMWLVFGTIWFLVLIYFIIKYFVTEYKLEMLYYKKKFIETVETKKSKKESVA